MTKDLTNQKVNSSEFDAIMVCTGSFAKPHVPEFSGQNVFTGKVMHSHDYRTSQGFENQRVLIVGIGNTAGDIAADLSYVASKVGFDLKLNLQDLT